jgi:hypothetical protein
MTSRSFGRGRDSNVLYSINTLRFFESSTGSVVAHCQFGCTCATSCCSVFDLPGWHEHGQTLAQLVGTDVVTNLRPMLVNGLFERSKWLLSLALAVG